MAVERSIKRNGRGQIISYPVSFDENGTPLQQYGKLGIGVDDSTDTEKYTKYSFFNEFIDAISDELRQTPTIVNINPTPIYTTEIIVTEEGATTSNTNTGTNSGGVGLPIVYPPFGQAGFPIGQLRQYQGVTYRWNGYAWETQQV